MNLYQKLRLIGLALKYPRISLAKLKEILRGNSRFPSEFPHLLAISLFSGCNLSCKMCGQLSDQKVRLRDTLPAEFWAKILKEAANKGSAIYLWGGEPTLHPEFPEILKIIKSNNLVCTINTNGSTLLKYAEQIVTNRIDSVNVSLDGPDKVHDSIRGQVGLFKRVTDGISLISRMARRYNIKKPLVKIVATLSEWNLNSMQDLIGEIECLEGVDMSIIQLGWFIPESAGLNNEKRIMSDFGIHATGWTGFKREPSRSFSTQARSVVSSILLDCGLRRPVLIFPNIAVNDFEAYYTDFYNTFGNTRCRSLERELQILSDGSVSVCLDWPDVVVGDLRHQTINEVWHGEGMIRFRKSLEVKGLFPVCCRCCGLFR
ncbi:MAG: hypothetical protein CVV41_12190 [Candidatus Riflebacteria bacterium HGW-Riflebacteria-1]|jgi:MoaA/NifB/PqqE/SkfB family radical SAM enzyme|nr:MAG: hypothetical protein CVV41_12190 [Candidatus Riflebacteria bacterium HGW-Riflebacteria-1]